MIEEIISRIFVYGYLFVAVFYACVVASPFRIFISKFPKLGLFFRRLNFISNWAIFTGMSKETMEFEFMIKLKSGKRLNWLLSNAESIGDIKIHNKTVRKNVVTFYSSYLYFHEVAEEKLLNYAFDVLKDPVVSFKVYCIKYNIDHNKNYLLGYQNRPKPSAPPELYYESRWES